MHSETIEQFRHSHDHVMVGHHEKRTRWVVAITAAMMVVELIVGTLTHSMALTADGWHMATHAGALGMSALAYWFARTRSREEAFSFGTGKVYALAGYTSAVVLGIVALLMFGESVRRLLRPEAIQFAQALPVAIVGLLVNNSELMVYLHRAIAASPSDLVFPGPDGKMLRKATQLEFVLRRAMRRASIVTGYVHKCRRKGCGHQEPTADANPRRCPKCNFKLCAVGQVRSIRFHHFRHHADVLIMPIDTGRHVLAGMADRWSRVPARFARSA